MHCRLHAWFSISHKLSINNIMVIMISQEPSIVQTSFCLGSATTLFPTIIITDLHRSFKKICLVHANSVVWYAQLGENCGFSYICIWSWSSHVSPLLASQYAISWAATPYRGINLTKEVLLRRCWWKPHLLETAKTHQACKQKAWLADRLTSYLLVALI